MHYSLILEKYKHKCDEDRWEAKLQTALKTRECRIAAGTSGYMKKKESF